MNDYTAPGGLVLAASAAYTSLSTISDVVQIAAGAVAIVSGLAAAWYYIDRTLAARKARRVSR